MLSRVRLFVTPWTVARQDPLSMGFSMQEYRIGLLFPSPGDLTDLRTEPMSPALADRFFTTEPPGKPAFLLVARVKIIYVSCKTNHASLTPHVAVVEFFRIHP